MITSASVAKRPSWVKAALVDLLHIPQCAQRRGPVTFVGRALGLKIVNANLLCLVQIPAGLGEERRHMAACTTCLAFENGLTVLSRSEIEAAGRRRGHWQRQLIEMQSWQLGSDAILLVLRMALPRARGDNSDDLREAFEKYFGATQHHPKRLEKVWAPPPRPDRCRRGRGDE